MSLFFGCYITRKSVQAAITALENDAEFVVKPTPFILNANVLPEGIPWFEHLLHKVGEKEARKEMKGNGPITKAGKEVGIKFDPERYVVNSVKSHLLVEFTLLKYGIEKANHLYDVMCQQYFEEGINLNSDRVLQNIASQMEIDQNEAVDFFTSPESAKKLFADINKMRKKGIHGVPHFQVSIAGYNTSKPLTFSGGQSKTGLLAIIRKLIKDYQKATKTKK